MSIKFRVVRVVQEATDIEVSDEVIKREGSLEAVQAWALQQGISVLDDEGWHTYTDKTVKVLRANAYINQPYPEGKDND